MSFVQNSVAASIPLDKTFVIAGVPIQPLLWGGFCCLLPASFRKLAALMIVGLSSEPLLQGLLCIWLLLPAYF